MARDEFPPTVKDAVAKRASFVCSNPDCRAVTIAPADCDATKVTYIGKAAHISAASKGGPRFDPEMTPAQRSDIANAIFLCSTCGDVIDRNGGADHPATTLRRWKAEHEDWVKANLNRRVDAPLSVVDGVHEAVGAGKVTALDIQGATIIKPGTISRASGLGEVTATRIGPVRKE